MITPKDLQEAIAYYSGKVEPKPNDAVMLAACYTLQDHLFPETKPEAAAHSIALDPRESNYSYSGANIESVGEYGESDFLLAVSGKDPAAAWAVMDEHMDALRMMNPRVYQGVLRKLRNL